MKEVGKIVDINGYDAVVEIERTPACGKCRACQFGDLDNSMHLTVPNRLRAVIGDLVMIDLESVQVLKASAIIYIVPLTGLIFGILLGYYIGGRMNSNPELIGAISGIILTALSFWGIKLMEPILKRSNKFSPQMVSIINAKRKGESENGQ